MAGTYFFFYGTLIAGSDNRVARAIHGRMRPVGRASVPGALWAIPDAAGWYPALVAEPGGRVRGMLYAATAQFGARDLARLDEWEDYRPAAPADSLYRRIEMTATDAAGTALMAQVYRFGQALPPAACPIPQGDFQAWLDATGYAAYGD